MIDLNRASIEDITATGVAADLARQMVLWGPFRSWDDLLWIDALDDDALADLRARGFELGAIADQNWAAPRHFALSAAKG
ncbi:helix-hairpin-helix domain-containing protein [Caulobacter soli]|uniref:helix-hairpin-helix domain-containing protein n=1 Tax=Caulobacter soli TaxID=2708539 RepID=UPI0013ECC1B3|nr:helix-hairpin-helix domain-containing protein [Caulobacter soli]